jgi:TetR/AcrR family transcriptional repressor of nem operon
VSPAPNRYVVVFRIGSEFPCGDFLDFHKSVMGHSQAEKVASRKRIIDIAARRFREKGFEGIGLAEVMQEAGLTVGAFYRHFQSRDELVTEALSLACEGLDQWEASAHSLQDAIQGYLTEAHRDALGTSCPLGALVSDVARSGPATRAVFTERVERTLSLVETLVNTPLAEDRRAQALVQLCAWVGAISLSRAVSDPALSKEILDQVSLQLMTPVTTVTDLLRAQPKRSPAAKVESKVATEASTEPSTKGSTKAPTKASAKLAAKASTKASTKLAAKPPPELSSQQSTKPPKKLSNKSSNKLSTRPACAPPPPASPQKRASSRKLAKTAHPER